MPDNPTPEMLKRLRTAETNGTHQPPQDKGKGKAVVRSEEEEEEYERNEGFVPDGDYFAEEDEDGRFYGGGLTSEQKEILNIFEVCTMLLSPAKLILMIFMKACRRRGRRGGTRCG